MNDIKTTEHFKDWYRAGDITGVTELLTLNLETANLHNYTGIMEMSKTGQSSRRPHLPSMSKQGI